MASYSLVWSQVHDCEIVWTLLYIKLPRVEFCLPTCWSSLCTPGQLQVTACFRSKYNLRIDTRLLVVGDQLLDMCCEYMQAYALLLRTSHVMDNVHGRWCYRSWSWLTSLGKLALGILDWHVICLHATAVTGNALNALPCCYPLLWSILVLARLWQNTRDDIHAVM